MTMAITSKIFVLLFMRVAKLMWTF